MSQFEQEVKSGARFQFGKNWARFLALLDEERIAGAEQSLCEMLGKPTLAGLRFLDIGSGSGLFSLAARRLGAHVHSFDFDPQSVACTQELRRRYFPEDDNWTIEEGSVLDRAYVESLGLYDIVYSWGVLHHTGAMWPAVENAAGRVRPGGQLFIALYNDQGWKSRGWHRIKRVYNELPSGPRQVFSLAVFGGVYLVYFAKATLRLKPWLPVQNWIQHRRRRGMNPYVDWTDWVGGYPYEVATPAAVEAFLSRHGFSLERLRETGSLGCNEFVLVRSQDVAPAPPAHTHVETTA